jgi:hypothetical protein
MTPASLFQVCNLHFLGRLWEKMAVSDPASRTAFHPARRENGGREKACPPLSGYLLEVVHTTSTDVLNSSATKGDHEVKS